MVSCGGNGCLAKLQPLALPVSCREVQAAMQMSQSWEESLNLVKQDPCYPFESV